MQDYDVGLSETDHAEYDAWQQREHTQQREMETAWWAWWRAQDTEQYATKSRRC